MKLSEILSPELLAKFLDYDRLREDLIKARQQKIAQVTDSDRPLTTKDRSVNVDVIYISQSDNISLHKTQH